MEEEEEFLDRKDRRFLRRLVRDRVLEAVKKERRPKGRTLHEIFSREEEVDEDDEVVDSARGRGAGSCDGVAAELAKSSLECRLSAPPRRELWGLRRRVSRIIIDTTGMVSRSVHLESVNRGGELDG